MAGALSFLAGLGRAGMAADTGRMEGATQKAERDKRDLLTQLAQQRQSALDAQAAEMQGLQRQNLLDQIRERNEAPVAAPQQPQYVDERGGYVSPDGTFRPVQGLPPKPKDAPGAYEERQEGGGVAVYENGQFKTWKIRPPSERGTSIGEQMEAQRGFQRENTLAGDFRQEQPIKDAYGVAGAVSTIRGALSQNTPQGDLAAIYALVKLYDPGSVVREGEIKLTQSATSLPQRVRLLYEGYRSGRKLLPEQRQAIADVANSVVDERQQQVNPVLQRYGARASRFGVDSAAVAPNPFEGARVDLGEVTTTTGRTFRRAP